MIKGSYQWQSVESCPADQRLILTENFEDVYAGEMELDGGQWHDNGILIPKPKAWIFFPSSEGLKWRITDKGRKALS